MTALRKVVGFGEEHPGLAFTLAAIALVCAIVAITVGILYPRVQAAAAYERSVADNAELCQAAAVIAYPPPSETPNTEFGKRLVAAMREFVESPDCPQS